MNCTKTQKMRILLCSEYTFLNTGYASYYREIAKSLHEAGHDVIELAGYGDPNNKEHVEYAHKCPWKIYLNVPNKDDMQAKEEYDRREKSTHDAKFGSWAFEKVCLTELPDTVIAIRDFWYDKFIVDSPLAKYMNVILSPTVDATPQRADWLAGFQKADYITSYNQWSENILRKQYNQANLVDHIAPAANKCFGPMSKNQARKILGLPENSKILLTVMRNQRRKRFPELFEGFAKYLQWTDAEWQDNNNNILYCHTHHQDRGWDLQALAQQYGIINHLYFTYKCTACSNIKASKLNANKVCKKCGAKMDICSVIEGVSDEELNIVYNSCDLYIQCHHSEGFGIPALEAAKTGKRVLSVDYSAQEDVIGKIGGYKIPTLALEREIETSCLRAVVNTEYLAELLTYDIWNYDSGEILALTNQNYSWEKTGQKWVDLVGSIKPKNTWASQPDIKTPVEFDKIAHLSNTDFVRMCILHVAHDPSLLGSFVHAECLEHLEVGTYIPEDKFNFQKSNFMIPIKKESVYSRFRRIRENINIWEKERVRRIHTLQNQQTSQQKNINSD